MKILITGASGQLGLTLQDVFDSDELILTDRDELDITDPIKVMNFVEAKKPEVIINAAGYTAVDKAEEERELARKINADGAGNLAAAAKKFNALFFHVSTDFVFDGKKTTPYLESDEPKPISEYGRSKLNGELAVTKVGGPQGGPLWGRYFILRTAWLYSPYGKNFVKTIAKLGEEKDELKVVSDQIGCPTYTYDLALAMKTLIEKANSSKSQGDPFSSGIEANNFFGLYHFAGEGECSWFEFAKKIVKLSGGTAKVLPQTAYEYAASRGEAITADRPKYSVLDCAKIQKLGINTPPWQESLKKCIDILKENKEL